MENTMPQSIAIQVQGLALSEGRSSEPKTASSYIPHSNIRPPTKDNTDWMSSSCGETPFLNDDIVSSCLPQANALIFLYNFSKIGGTLD